MAKIAEVQEVAIAVLKPYERNAKQHGADQIEKLIKSIEEFGFLTPCLIDRDNNIIAGHGRVMAARKMGMQTVPCVYIEGLSEAQRKAYILADNRLGELGEWDMDLVMEELTALDDMDFDVTVTGFDLPDLTEADEVAEDDYSEDVETRCKLGDLWQLGDHRLICGDSTDVNVIDRLMDGQKAELLLTDPPYGIDVVQNKQVGGGDLHFKKGKVGGGSANTPQGNLIAPNVRVESKTYMPVIGDETTETARANYNVAIMHTQNQIIFGGNYFTDFLPPSRCWIVWDKENTGNFADAELAWTSFDRGVKLYHFMWNGLAREGSRIVEGKTRVHPTQKPVGMLSYILKDFSAENDKVLDCFGGSGSTLIACEQLNRKCYMAELDPHYCDVIINRWEQLTGREAVLINA